MCQHTFLSDSDEFGRSYLKFVCYTCVVRVYYHLHQYNKKIMNGLNITKIHFLRQIISIIIIQGRGKSKAFLKLT